MLDTNICIYIRRKRPEQVLKRFRRLRLGEAVISVITYGELIYGVEKSQYREKALADLRELVRLLPAVALPEHAADSYGTLRANLSSRGEIIGNNDLWIAAHAIASGLILVTNNEKEFRRLPSLKTQNWAEVG